MGRMGPMERMNEAEQEHDLGLAAGGLGDAQIVSCLLWRRDGLAVDFDVFEFEADGVANGETGFGFDVDVFEGDVAKRALGKAGDMAGSSAVCGGEIADGDVSKSGRAFVGRRRLAKLFGKPGGAESVHVEVEDLAHPIGLNVFVEDIFDDTAAAHACFEANNFAAAVVSAAIVDADVADAAGGFAAETDEAGGVAHAAVADDYVFGGTVDTEAVGIATGFEADGVVVAFDVATGDEDVAGGIEVDAVGAGGFDGFVRSADFEMVDFDAVTIGELEVPERGVLEEKVADEDFLAANDVNETRTRHFEMWIDVILFALACVPILAPPTFTGTVEGAFAGELEVGDPIGVDECGGPSHFEAGDAGVNPGIVVGVLRAFEDGVFFESKIDALFEENGAGDECAFGDDKLAAAGFGAGVDGGLDGLGVEGFGVADCAETCNSKIARSRGGRQTEERDTEWSEEARNSKSEARKPK